MKIIGKVNHCLIVGVFTLLSITNMAYSQATRPPATNPPAVGALKDGWEEIDQRMVFLTVQLASVEASLTAVNKAITGTGYQQIVKKDTADRYRKGNELMDRNAGGPTSWKEFYGTAAEKFFYHPMIPTHVTSIQNRFPSARHNLITSIVPMKTASSAPRPTSPKWATKSTVERNRLDHAASKADTSIETITPDTSIEKQQ